MFAGDFRLGFWRIRAALSAHVHDAIAEIPAVTWQDFLLDGPAAAARYRE